jgi:uncharacterized membrane protein
VQATYIIHIAAGALGLLTGFVALWTSKGDSLHRRAGLAFVIVMVVMTSAGFLLTVVRDVAMSTNVPAAVITAYLVVTAFTTVRPLTWGGGVVHLAGMAVAFVTGIVCLRFASVAIASGTMDGMPPFPFVLFGTLGILSGIGDARVSLRGPLTGAARITRHLWRMCIALFVAALSFFIGQSDEFPKAIRILPLLALPVLAVLVTMVYWLWRVRLRKSLRGLILNRGITPPAGDQRMPGIVAGPRAGFP